MDDHARQMVQRFLDSVEAFRDGRISMLDLSRHAQQVAATIDNASAPIPAMLLAVEGELEYAHFASEEADRDVEAERIIAPLLAAIDRAARD